MYDIRRITAQGNLQKSPQAKLKKPNKNQPLPEEVDGYKIYHHVLFNKTSALVHVSLLKAMPKPREVSERDQTGKLANYYERGILHTILLSTLEPQG